MNTLQLIHALDYLLEPASVDGRNTKKSVFKGVYPIDCIPKRKQLTAPFAIIINTQPADQEGEHWIALYQPYGKNKSLEYFDSYGMQPLPEIIQALGPKSIRFNGGNQLQSFFSAVCGQYCVVFLFCRITGMLSFASFMNLFKWSDTTENDMFISLLFDSLIPTQQQQS